MPHFGGKSASDSGRLWTVPHAASMEAASGPGPRAAHSCNLINGKLFVFGGWNGKRGLNDLHVLGERCGVSATACVSARTPRVVQICKPMSGASPPPWA